MAVLQMQRISICALNKNRKQVLESLQRSGTVEICDLTSQDSVFEKNDTLSAKSQFEKTIAVLHQALEVLDSHVPAKTSALSSLSGRKIISSAEYEVLSGEQEKAVKTANRLIALSKNIAENKAELLKLQTQMDALVPWMSLQISMRFTGTRTTAAFIGSFPEEYSLEKIYTDLARLAPETSAVNVEVISQSQDQTCVLVLVSRAYATEIDQALRAMGFIRPSSPSKQPPAQRKAILEERVAQAELEIEQAQKEIKSLSDTRNSLQFAVDYYSMRLEKYDTISKLLCSRHTFILSGYIPKKAKLTRPPLWRYFIISCSGSCFPILLTARSLQPSRAWLW